MLAFHPYGQQDTKVVSDTSRFEFTPRIRSRNPTPPTRALDTVEDSPIQEQEVFREKAPIHSEVPTRNPTMIEIAERAKREEEKMAFYDDYMQESVLGMADPPHPPLPPNKIHLASTKANLPFPFTPVPAPMQHIISELPEPAVQAPRGNVSATSFHPYPDSLAPSLPPTLPKKDSKFEVDRQPSHYGYNPIANTTPIANRRSSATVDTLHDNFIPTHLSTQPRTLAEANLQFSNKNGELESILSSKNHLEEKLIKSVMNRPLFSIPTKKFVGFNNYEDSELVISYNFIFYLFEFVFSISVIVLAAVLLDKDDLGKSGIYKFFIADASITLFVSILFIFEAINFEKRNGSFYCLLACIMNLVSFIMTISTILPDNTCTKRSFCRMRKAVSSFIILSMFIWFANLVMFATTFYISRLNLLGDINFDFSEKGLGDTHMKEFPTPAQVQEMTPVRDSQSLKFITPTRSRSRALSGIDRGASGIDSITPQELLIQQQIQEQIMRDEQRVRDQQKIREEQLAQQKLRQLQLREYEQREREQQEFEEFQQYKFQKQRDAEDLQRQQLQRSAYPTQSAIPKTPTTQQQRFLYENSAISRNPLTKRRSTPKVVRPFIDPNTGHAVPSLYQDLDGNIVEIPLGGGEGRIVGHV